MWVHGMCVSLCEVLGAGSSAVVRALRVAGDAGDGVSWHVLACRSGASRQSRVLGARGASRRGGDGPPFSVTWTFWGMRVELCSHGAAA